MDKTRTFSTPMMQQYMQIKQQYADCILMFRLGDFYELFLDDAEIGSQILGITLTARPRGKDGDIPMAGVPFHSAESYINKLVRAGFKVAICEQTTEPDGKGIVERDVVRIITPGTITNESNLDHKTHNYLMSIANNDSQVGITIAELTTGEIVTTSFSIEQLSSRLPNELAKFQPSEIIYSPDSNPEIIKIIPNHSNAKSFALETWTEYLKQPLKYFRSLYSSKLIKELQLKTNTPQTDSIITTLRYLEHTQQQLVKHLSSIRLFSEYDSVVLDPSTITNLELFETLRDHQRHGSLIDVLDQTSTSMGGRLLRQWLKHPLNKQKSIEERLDAVEFFVQNSKIRKDIKEQLKHISDLERMVSRINLNLGNPKDLIRLQTTLEHITQLKKNLDSINIPLVNKQTKALTKQLFSISKTIASSLKDSVPVDPKKGNFMQEGLDKELDRLRLIINTSKEWIAKAQETERVRTGIGSLKIKFNKVFGYYIDISKSNLDQVPSNYERRQTLVNSERFITPELKHHEEIILANEVKAQELELGLFNDLLAKIIEQTLLLQKAARAIAEIDCIVSLATIAIEYNYSRPKFQSGTKLHLTESRHPVVERLLRDKQFVPNDALFNKTQQLLVITGPNMAGKSVYMRQVALVTLMAHIGSFVPAKKAELSLVDRIFVRSGAGDAISQGLSTFMVEMVETAQILNLATEKSLVIMDEIGRGTTTYDGISIAWAVAEYLVTTIGAKTLFATHYHELQALENEYPNRIKNYHAAVELHQGEPVFIHRVLVGKAQASYGISVAKLAGVPTEVASQANKVLKTLENNDKPISPTSDKNLPQMSLFETNPHYETMIEQLKNVDILNITPLEALNLLSKIKKEMPN